MKWRFLTILAAVAALIVVLAVAGARAADKAGKAYIGLYPEELTSDVAADYGVQPGQGILVNDVVSDGPADKAGLRANDVIIRVGAAPVTGPSEFRKLLAKYKPDDEVDIVYLRGGKERTVKIKLGKRHGTDFDFGVWPLKAKGKTYKFEGPPWEWRSEENESDKVAFAGLVTQSLSKGLKTYFKAEKGALISEVVKDSPAERAGLKAGDVITKIGDHDVEDESDVSSAIHDFKPGDAVDFVIVRDGTPTTIKVTLGERLGSREVNVLGDLLEDPDFKADLDRAGELGDEISADVLKRLGDRKVLVWDEADAAKLKACLKGLKDDLGNIKQMTIVLRGDDAAEKASKELEKLRITLDKLDADSTSVKKLPDGSIEIRIKTED